MTAVKAKADVRAKPIDVTTVGMDVWMEAKTKNSPPKVVHSVTERRR